MTDIGEYVKKLVHPIAEIRERTLSTVLQKVECNLVNISKLSQHPNLLQNLLKLLDLGPHTLRVQVLKLLHYVLEFEDVRQRFDSLGGLQYLQTLKIVASLEVVPHINSVLQKFNHHSVRREIIHEPDCNRVSNEINLYDADRVFDEENSTLPSLYYSSDTEQISVTRKKENTIIEDSCAYDESEPDVEANPDEPPVTFKTFPWQALTNSDRRVLDSTTQSLLSHDESLVVASLHFLDTVVLKDFPAEVMLQRPAVLRAIYGCIEEGGDDAWRVQGPACACLLSLTQLLNDRVAQFKDPHLSPSGQQTVTPTSSGIATPSTDITRGSCCSSSDSRDGFVLDARNNIRRLGDGQDRSGSVTGLVHGLSATSIHEDDDGDEFILLGMHQLTIGGHCSHVFRVSCPLLVSNRPSLQTVSMRLMLSCISLLDKSVNSRTLWNHGDDGDEAIMEIVGSLRRLIRNICAMIIIKYETQKLYKTTIEAEEALLTNQCLLLLLCKILHLFVPLEAFNQIIDRDVSASLILALCDGGFYLEYRKEYDFLHPYVSKVMPDIAAQMKCILYAADALKITAAFLQTSSARLEEFLKFGEKALSVASIHQSSVFVEKLVRGLAKQVSIGNSEINLLEEMRKLLLQVLHHPDVTVRLCGYTSVLRLIEDNIGMSQAANTSQSRSPRILLLLSPSVICCFVYSGLTDDNNKVRNLSQNILLGLLRGRLLMNKSIWMAAAECWRHTLIHLQCLAESVTSLGRAVGNLHEELYKEDRVQNIERVSE
ncbi:hypothetical protein SK128_024999 [Halocaridina rubra]|uniref:Rotatin N-terminal domain-containing protein n=1 Tax=Halocaridina rubra TaxID=373956 RepID=A0AAN8WWC3_HALRR